MPYSHLTLQERYCIAHMHMHKMSIRTIATRLSRSPSTISRELKRNKLNSGVFMCSVTIRPGSGYQISMWNNRCVHLFDSR